MERVHEPRPQVKGCRLWMLVSEGESFFFFKFGSQWLTVLRWVAPHPEYVGSINCSWWIVKLNIHHSFLYFNLENALKNEEGMGEGGGNGRRGGENRGRYVKWNKKRAKKTEWIKYRCHFGETVLVCKVENKVKGMSRTLSRDIGTNVFSVD